MKWQNADRQGDPGPYHFFFYSFDCNEPGHVHVQRENKVRKYWLALGVGRNDDFSVRELNQIRALIALNLETILEAWHEQCG
jgi:hypothetical protein